MRRRGRKPATRPSRRSNWPSSPACSACRPGRRLLSCSATCSASRQLRWRACSTLRRSRSRAACSGPARRCARARIGRRGRDQRPSVPWPVGSPMRTWPEISAAWSRCSPTTHGCPCRQRPTSIRAPPPSGLSCRPASVTAAGAGCPWCLPRLTRSPPWPATLAARRRSPAGRFPGRAVRAYHGGPADPGHHPVPLRRALPAVRPGPVAASDRGAARALTRAGAHAGLGRPVLTRASACRCSRGPRPAGAQ